MKDDRFSIGRQDTLESHAPAQAVLKDRKLTQWQENFARYIFQETGYIVDMQSLKLTLLLQKQFRNSPWNKARLGKADQPDPLPELPYQIDQIAMHLPEHHEPKVTTESEAKPARTRAGWAAEADLQLEMGPFWEYRRTEPINWIFTPEPQPDPAVIEKFSNRIEAARKKAGRRKTT